ncbi:uncharacterized protein DDB_G0283697-like [Tripterygium wilfordii]|uniref:uncharacterized protein DDB_G0283697-like n=1 Tax=Tripterygium wilfordii TaxID=458696 RepID=UPI0018F85A6D|nr:uncharacterized protein DDB_G0283697-like [Tripterygium wilfordii]
MDDALLFSVNLDLVTEQAVHPVNRFSRQNVIQTLYIHTTRTDCFGLSFSRSPIYFFAFFVSFLLQSPSDLTGLTQTKSCHFGGSLVPSVREYRKEGRSLIPKLSHIRKFIQLVEEKKKRALEKKEAPLKWEQKLEAAAKAKADAEAKDKKSRALKHQRRSVSESDTESDNNSSDGGRKNRRTHKKHRKHAHSDSGDNEKRKDKRSSRRKPKRRSSDSSDDGSDEFLSGSDEDRRKKRSYRRHKHQCDSDSSASDFSSDDREDEMSRSRRSAKHHKRHRQSEYVDADSPSERTWCNTKKPWEAPQMPLSISIY